MQSAPECNTTVTPLPPEERRPSGQNFDTTVNDMPHDTPLLPLPEAEQPDCYLRQAPTNTIEYCISHYHTGMKVKVGIPLPNARTFHDWAIINETDEDLVALQLSRDYLPDGVTLRVGQFLTLRSEHDGQVHTCRCLIVSMGYDRELLLRLVGEIFSGETREYYRVDAFFPITYQRLPDQAPATVKKQWEARLRRRQDEKRTREQRRLEVIHERTMRGLGPPDNGFSGEPAAFSSNKGEGAPQDPYDELLSTAETLAVTIGGGGIKIPTNCWFDMGEFIQLEILVPSSRQIVDAVGRVVFTRRNEIAEGNRDRFDIGMQFVHIAESARQAINSHISAIQISRIRHFKGFADVEPLYGDGAARPDRQYAYINRVDAVGGPRGPVRSDWWQLFRQAALGLLFVCVITMIGFYFSGYVVDHSKNDIQKFFENEIARRKG